MRRFARRFYVVAMAAVVLTGGGNALAAIVAAHLAPSGLAHALAGAIAHHDHAAAGHVADHADYQGTCGQSGCDGPDHPVAHCPHGFVHCCGAPLLPAGDYVLKLAGDAAASPFVVEPALPHGELTSPPLRPPRTSA